LPRKLLVKNMLTKVLSVKEIKQSMALLLEKPKLRRRLPLNIELKHLNLQFVETLILYRYVQYTRVRTARSSSGNTVTPQPLHETGVNCGSRTSSASPNVMIGDSRPPSGNMRIGHHYRRHRLNLRPRPLRTSMSIFRELSLPARQSLWSHETQRYEYGGYEDQRSMNDSERINSLWIDSERNYAI